MINVGVDIENRLLLLLKMSSKISFALPLRLVKLGGLRFEAKHSKSVIDTYYTNFM